MKGREEGVLPPAELPGAAYDNQDPGSWIPSDAPSPMTSPSPDTRVLRTLKQDHFGRVLLVTRDEDGGYAIRRDLLAARWWIRPVARFLARREARALRRLEGLEGVPRLLHSDRRGLLRSHLEGTPLHEAAPRDPAFYTAALELVAGLHARGVAHNDLHKEPNWLVTPEGRPAVIDFQMASCMSGRGPWSRMLIREDRRHALKHKRTYCPDDLSEDERAALSRRSLIAGIWWRTGKPLYNGITRRLLRWSDREGAGERPPGG